MKPPENGMIHKVQTRIRFFKDLLRESSPLLEAISRATGILKETLVRGGKVLVCGNGGSAAQAAHFAAELVNRFYRDRIALPALSLAADLSVITSIANDSEYRHIFSRQIEALGTGKDTLVALTTSGRSPNILEALQRAADRDLATICLCGNRTDSLKKIDPDALISVPSTDTPLIQEAHLFVLHHLTELIEKDQETGEAAPGRIAKPKPERLS